MTPDELRALADRAVACRHWRPMAGMRDLQGRTWTPDLLWRWHPHDRPDLSDPATLGCLLALVREAWGDKRTAVKWWEPEGCAYYAHPLDTWQRPTTLFASEAEALVAALEAAP